MMQHLLSLKLFLFLGQGDFISVLLEGLHKEDGLTPSLYTVQGILEMAVRSSNARYLPVEALDRLQVELEDDVDDESEQGSWMDRFNLTYLVPSPLFAIVHSEAMQQYKLIFGLLFRLKRVEYQLNSTWRQGTALNHALHRQRVEQGFDDHMVQSIGVNKNFEKADCILRKLSITRQSLVHFVTNMESYLMFGVLEVGWKTLTSKVQSASTFDEVIHAHNNYLEHVAKMCFLAHNMDNSNNNSSSSVVEVMLKMCEDFCIFQKKAFWPSFGLVRQNSTKAKGGTTTHCSRPVGIQQHGIRHTRRRYLHLMDQELE